MSLVFGFSMATCLNDRIGCSLFRAGETSLAPGFTLDSFCLRNEDGWPGSEDEGHSPCLIAVDIGVEIYDY